MSTGFCGGFLLCHCILIMSALQGFSSPDNTQHQYKSYHARRALQTAFLAPQLRGNFHKDYQGKIRRDHQTLSKSTLGLSRAGSELRYAINPMHLYPLAASERMSSPIPLASTRFRLTHSQSLPSVLLALHHRLLRTTSTITSLSASISTADPAAVAIDQFGL